MSNNNHNHSIFSQMFQGHNPLSSQAPVGKPEKYKYPDPSVIRGIFPRNWDIKNIEVKIAKGFDHSDIVVEVTRLLKEYTEDLEEGIHPECLWPLRNINCEWSSSGVIVGYSFSFDHGFYCDDIPRISKELFEKEFHDDFENTQP